MNEPPTIVVGATDTPPPHRRRPRSLQFAAVALIVVMLWGFGSAGVLSEAAVPVTVRLIGSSPVEAEPWLYEVSAAGVSEARLPDLRDVQFDRSGRLVAGIAPSEEARGGVLTVGPPEGPFEHLGDGVRSFAWHDRRPGSLAFVTPWGPVGLINIWEQGANSRERAIEGGLMHRFGDWGYAVTRPDPTRRADLYDASGRFGHQVPGYSAGTGPGGYLVFTPQVPDRSPQQGRAEAFGYTDEGESFDIPWLQEGELPYAIEAAPDGRRYAVHLGGTFESGLGEVLIVRFDGTIEARISQAATPPASAWSPDGRYLAVARRAQAGGLEIGFYDLEAETLDVTAVTEIPVSVVVWDIVVADPS